MKNKVSKPKAPKVKSNNVWQEVGLLAQLMFSFSVLFFGGVCLFNADFLIPVEKLLALTLLTMAYNNHVTFKRKAMTAVYTIIGLAILIIACMGW